MASISSVQCFLCTLALPYTPASFTVHMQQAHQAACPPSFLLVVCLLDGEEREAIAKVISNKFQLYGEAGEEEEEKELELEGEEKEESGEINEKEIEDEQNTISEEEDKLSLDISDDTFKNNIEGFPEDSPKNRPDNFCSYADQSMIEGLAEDMLEDMPEDLSEDEDEDDEDMEPVLPEELGEVWELRDEEEIMKRLGQCDQSKSEGFEKLENDNMEDSEKEDVEDSENEFMKDSENEFMKDSENADKEGDIEDRAEKSFSCDQCPAVTKFQISLKKHKEKHHINQQNEASKLDHIVEHFECFVDECPYKSRFKSNLNRHIKVMHHGVKTPKRIRRKKRSSVDNLGSRLSCNKCDFTSKFANRFNNHVLEKHTDLLTSRRGRNQPQRKDSKEIKCVDGKYFCDQCEFNTTEVLLIQKHRVGSHGSRQETQAETKVEAGVTNMEEAVAKVKEEVNESNEETLSESPHQALSSTNTSWSQFLLGSINPDLPSSSAPSFAPPLAPSFAPPPAPSSAPPPAPSFAPPPPPSFAPPPAPSSAPPPALAPQSLEFNQDTIMLMSNGVGLPSNMSIQPKMKSCHQIQRRKQKFKDEQKKSIGEDTTHLSLVSGKGVCPTCGVSKANVRAHYMSVHIKGEFPCLMCDHVSTSSMKLSDHKYRKHPETRKVNRNHDNTVLAL